MVPGALTTGTIHFHPTATLPAPRFDLRVLLRVIAFACGMQYHQTAVVPRESILKAEVEWLNSIKADLVVWYHDH